MLETTPHLENGMTYIYTTYIGVIDTLLVSKLPANIGNVLGDEVP